MKRLLVILQALLLLPACFQKKDDFIVINVLEPSEYNDCHIKGSINIPFEELTERVSAFSKDATIVLYCSNYACTASMYGAQMLQQRGFHNVYAYEEGMAGWYQQGLPVVGPCLLPYLKEENKKLEDTPEDVRIITTASLKEKIKQKLAVTISS